jgi:hypothetical protein
MRGWGGVKEETVAVEWDKRPDSVTGVAAQGRRMNSALRAAATKSALADWGGTEQRPEQGV